MTFPLDDSPDFAGSPISDTSLICRIVLSPIFLHFSTIKSKSDCMLLLVFDVVTLSFFVVLAVDVDVGIVLDGVRVCVIDNVVTNDLSRFAVLSLGI